MGIHFDAKRQIFHLKARGTSYVMQIVREGYLAHLYWGKRVLHYDEGNVLSFVYRSFSPNPDISDRTFSLDTLPQEYPAYGNTDFRAPAYQIQLKNGTTITDFRYKTHLIFKGKKKLAGLPSTYVEEEDEAVTLEIILEDKLIELKVILTYTVFEEFNAITRSV
ncbi:MAG: glycoside hydrolase family 36 N-terminal domain-containing protein, partial [Bacillota bacterium]|nr:glycoside hydrolase family 36 N-terminal domain-containing protein [Bacillota bacterium]